MEQSLSDRAKSRKPTAEQLMAAVEAVKTRWEPEEIILFGSAARGTMHERSDIDLLVITNQNGSRNDFQREWLDINGKRLDIVMMTAAQAELHRRTAARVQQSALEEGVIIHHRGRGAPPVPVGRSFFTNESGMVKSSKLKPDESHTFLKRAEKHWKTSNGQENDNEIRCYHRHQAIEQSLKGLITAQGESFEHLHDLNELWDQAEKSGEQIPAQRDNELLKNLTEYAGNWRYEAEDPERDLRIVQGSEKLTADVIDHVREAIPRLARKTGERLKETPRLVKPPSTLYSDTEIDHSNDRTGSAGRTDTNVGDKNQ